MQKMYELATVSQFVSQHKCHRRRPRLFAAGLPMGAFKWTASQWPIPFLSLQRWSFDMLGLHASTARNNPMRRRFWLQPCVVQATLHQNGSTDGSPCRRWQWWTGLNIRKMEISPNFISVSGAVFQEQQQDSPVDSWSNVVHQLRYSIISNSAFNKQNN